MREYSLQFPINYLLLPVSLNPSLIYPLSICVFHSFNILDTLKIAPQDSLPPTILLQLEHSLVVTRLVPVLQYRRHFFSFPSSPFPFRFESSTLEAASFIRPPFFPSRNNIYRLPPNNSRPSIHLLQRFRGLECLLHTNQCLLLATFSHPPLEMDTNLLKQVCFCPLWIPQFPSIQTTSLPWVAIYTLIHIIPFPMHEHRYVMSQNTCSSILANPIKQSRWHYREERGQRAQPTSHTPWRGPSHQFCSSSAGGLPKQLSSPASP